MMLINSARIRAIIADCRTEQDIVLSLRLHKVKYSFSTDCGYTSIRIPCRSGCIRIIRVASRSAPFLVRSENPRRSGSAPDDSRSGYNPLRCAAPAVVLAGSAPIRSVPAPDYPFPRSGSAPRATAPAPVVRSGSVSGSPLLRPSSVPAPRSAPVAPAPLPRSRSSAPLPENFFG